VLDQPNGGPGEKEDVISVLTRDDKSLARSITFLTALTK
jgi:hypothetical protein